MIFWGDSMCLGERLVILRKDKGLLQIQVAQAVGLSLRGYQRYERDERSPDADILLALADFFGVSVDYLTGRSDISLTAEAVEAILSSWQAASDAMLQGVLALQRIPVEFAKQALARPSREEMLATFARRVWEKREAQGLTQSQLGAMIELTAQEVDDIEHAKDWIPLRIATKIALALHTSVEYLYGMRDE